MYQSLPEPIWIFAPVKKANSEQSFFFKNLILVRTIIMLATGCLLVVNYQPGMPN